MTGECSVGAPLSITPRAPGLSAVCSGRVDRLFGDLTLGLDPVEHGEVFGMLLDAVSAEAADESDA